MEVMDILLAATRDASYYVVNHPIYSVIGCFAAIVCLVRFYFTLTFAMCHSDQNMEGKTVLITGATAGIGKATAEDMARRKARVILACRNMEKANRVANGIKSSTGNQNVVVKHLELSSFDSVRKCAEDVLRTEERLDVLINNAGIFPERFEITEDGCEKVMQSNHLGHFLLTLLLLDLIKKSSPSRIVNVASSSYEYGKLDLSDMTAKNPVRPFELYSRSKLANILFTKELAKRLRSSGVTVNAVHPGLVKTDIIPSKLSISYYVWINQVITGKSWEEGAQTTIYLAVDPGVKCQTGKYFAECKEEKLVGKALDASFATQLFEESERIVGVKYQ